MIVLWFLALGSFSDCFNGVDQKSFDNESCIRYDSDKDGDVDLRDYAYFQIYGEPHMAIRYVNANPSIGNDTYDGTSPTFVSGLVGPWRTINRALTAVPDATNTVYLEGSVAFPFTERITSLSTNINNKTVIFDGQNAAIWTYSLSNALSTITNSAATNFNLTFQNMTITRTGASGTCYFFTSTVATGSGTCSLSMINVNFDHQRRFFLHNSTGSTNKFSVTIDNCPYFRFGDYCIFINGSCFAGDIVLRDTVFSKTQAVTGSNAQMNVFINIPIGANVVNSIVFDNITHIHDTTTTGGAPMSLGNIQNGVSITDCTFYYRASSFTNNTSPYRLVCGGNLTLTGNRFYEQGGGSEDNGFGTRSANTVYHWLELYASGDINISDNIISAYGRSQMVSGNARALYIGQTGDNAIVDNNTIISAGSGMQIELFANSGTLDVTNNSIFVDGTNVLMSTPTSGYTIGQLTNGDATYAWSTVNVNDNIYDGTDCGVTAGIAGIGMFLGRDINDAGGNYVLRNKIISPTITQKDVNTTYGFYAECSHTTFNYNKVHSRSAMTTVGVQDSVIEYNTFAATFQRGGKGMLGFNQHEDLELPSTPHPTKNLVVRYNLFDVTELNNVGPDVNELPTIAESSVVYTESTVPDNTNVLCDYNWYALPVYDGGQPEANRAYIGQHATTQKYLSTTVAELAEKWVSAVEADARWDTVSGNDVHSWQSVNGMTVDPANGDFSISEQGLSLLCALPMMIGAEAYTCPTASLGITRRVRTGDRGTEFSITPSTGSTRTQWNIVQSGFSGGAYYFTSNYESTSSPNVLVANLSKLSLWLPPYHTYEIRYREYVDGVWTEWSEYFEYQSRGPLTSFEKFYALNAGTETLANGRNLTPAVPVGVDTSLNR